MKKLETLDDLSVFEDKGRIVFYARITHGKPRYEGVLPKFVINIPKYIVKKYSLKRGMIVKVIFEPVGVIADKYRIENLNS